MSLKTNSSKQLQAQQWPEITQALGDGHFWNPSYCITSTGETPLETIEQYIENQEKPRRKYQKRS